MMMIYFFSHFKNNTSLNTLCIGGTPVYTTYIDTAVQCLGKKFKHNHFI